MGQLNDLRRIFQTFLEQGAARVRSLKEIFKLITFFVPLKTLAK